MQPNERPELAAVLKLRARLRELISRHSGAARAYEKQLHGTLKEAGELEYGPVGSDITYLDSSGRTVIATVLYFEDSMWSDIPRAILKVKCDRPFETHLCNGRGVIRG